MLFKRKKYRLKINGRGRHNFQKKWGPTLVTSRIDTKKVPKKCYKKPFLRRII